MTFSRSPIKYLCQCNPDVLTESTDPTREIQYVDIGNVRSNGTYTYEPLLFGDAPSRARRLARDGDVIISTVRTYLRAIAYVRNAPDNLVVSTGFAVLRPKQNIDSRFFAYAVQSNTFVDEVVSRSQGVSYPAITPQELFRIEVPVPNPHAQERIADFLDHETAESDALVADFERLIRLFEERRLTLSQHAVTKGLDPNVPMKDSGIDWIGNIPTHWDVGRLAPYIVDKTDGPFGSGLKNEHYTTSGIRVIRLQNIGAGTFKDDDASFVSEEYFQSLGGHEARPGDVLVAGLGDENNPLGRACALPPHIGIAMVKADCFRYRFDQKRVLNQFAINVLNSLEGRHSSLLLSRGATRQRMNLSAVGSMIVALPPAAEQSVINAWLSARIAEIEAIRNNALKSISLIQERRSALITAAVTGQIDVTSYTPESTKGAA